MIERIELDWVDAMGEVVGAKIKWIEVQPLTKPGDNYASILSRAALGYRLDGDQSSNDEEITVVLKAPIQHKDAQVKASLNGYFQSEIMMYKEIFEIYNGLLKEKPIFDKMWPQCYFVNESKILVLEDLKILGYELPHELGRMPDDHILLVLEGLGRFHSLSVVTTERGLFKPEGDSRFGLFLTEEGLGYNFVLTGMKSVSDAISQTWSEEWKPVSEKLMKIRERIIPELKRLEKEEARVKVINHGDPWSRNMLIKYIENKPTSVRFVDFQNPMYNSFGVELAHFLTALGVTPDEYTNNQFLETYCNAFKSTLEQMGSDLKLAPTVEEALAELNRLKLFRLVVSCTVTPLAMYESDVPVSMDDIMVLDENHQRNNDAYTNEKFAKIFQKMWKYYEDII